MSGPGVPSGNRRAESGRRTDAPSGERRAGAGDKSSRGKRADKSPSGDGRAGRGTGRGGAERESGRRAASPPGSGGPSRRRRPGAEGDGQDRRRSPDQRETGRRGASGGSSGRGDSTAENANRRRGGGKVRGDRDGGGRGNDSRREQSPRRGADTGRGPARGGSRPARPGTARRDAVVDTPRLVARDLLRAVRERDAYANLVLPALLREHRLSGRDAAFATELAYGACRALGILDAVIADCAGRAVDEIDGPLLDVLRLGVYQLLRTRVGAHAAVDTSVDLVRSEYGSGRAGFVNAVLRRAAARSPQQWVERLAPPDPVGRSAFEYGHPVWIAQAFADALGSRAGELRELLAADDQRPIVHLVARPGDITAEELALISGGEEGRWSPYAVYLDSGDPAQLEPVRERMAGVQDEGSQLVALSLTRAPLLGEDRGRWLDLCAGPGGKAALLGALAGIDGFEVDAVEPAEHRAELVRKATRDLPVTVHVADGRDSGLTPGYDRILVDAPCTGLGALRRRPEARWRRTPADVPDLTGLQRELLDAAWELLRPGGVVVYSTCSPHLAETVAVVADVVRRTGAEQLETRELLPGVTDTGDGPAAQLWPHRHGTDAMFAAALRKPL